MRYVFLHDVMSVFQGLANDLSRTRRHIVLVNIFKYNFVSILIYFIFYFLLQFHRFSIDIIAIRVVDIRIGIGHVVQQQPAGTE